MNDVPKLFGGVPINDLKNVAQKLLSTVCTCIGQHKGEWSNTEVEKFAIDTYSCFMQKVMEHSILVRVKDEKDA